LKSGEIAGCPYVIVALRDLLPEIFAGLIANETATLRRVETATSVAPRLALPG
jgi:hypothetical protein